MMTQELKKKKKEIKFGGVFIRKRQKRCTEKVREERLKTGKYNRKEIKKKKKKKKKRIVFVLWPNSLEQLSS